MRGVVALLLAAAALTAAPIRLAPGDNRYIQFSIAHVPSLVDCRFRVLQGGATVHLEIMSDLQYRRFNRGRDYEPLATSPDGSDGEIRRLLDERGKYDVVVINGQSAAAALVELEVRTDLNPDAESMARVLSPERRLTVILISFGFFFAVLTWAGTRLLRATRQAKRESGERTLARTETFPRTTPDP